MGINYNYDIDTVGGGWYLYELDFPPVYIAPLKKNANGREGNHAWGIFGDGDRMSEFRVATARWNPAHCGFVDGYIIDETHDKYWGGHLGEKRYIVDATDHRWPCFCMDAQVVAGFSILRQHFERASLGGDYEGGGFGIALYENDRLADYGFRFRLPDLPEAIEYLLKNDIPSDHYLNVACRLIESRQAKQKLGARYGVLGWAYGGDGESKRLVFEDRQEPERGPVGEMLDKLAAAHEKRIAAGDCELTLKHLQGTMDGDWRA